MGNLWCFDNTNGLMLVGLIELFWLLQDYKWGHLMLLLMNNPNWRIRF